MAAPDFLSTNLGSVVQLTAETPAAQEWAAANLALDPDLPPVVTVEAGYFLDIAFALLEAGLTMMDTTTGRYAELPETVH